MSSSFILNSFSEWSVEEFIYRNVGKTRDSLNEIAQGNNLDFSVRHCIAVVLDANAEGVCKFQPRATPWVRILLHHPNSERVRHNYVWN
jgi:hypothetical protein